MVIDSNIIIYGANPANLSITAYLSGKLVLCSQISLVETLGFHKITDKEKTSINQLLSLAIIVAINDEIISSAIELRQSKKMSLGDSIIAATALHWGFPLLTNNEKDFIGITGLQVIPLSSI